MPKPICPDCKRSSRFQFKKEEGKFYCEYCGKYYDKAEYIETDFKRKEG